MNKISVIIPIYNIGHYIERSVNSVLNQTFRDIEVILVNDGSTDNSRKIIEELAKKDSRIIVINKENGGVSSARMEGIKIATGDWIGFVDGDDYIEPGMYEFLLNNGIKEKADISHCGYQMVFPSRVDYYYNTGNRYIQNNLTGLKDLLKGYPVEPGLCNKLYKREIIDRFINEVNFDLSIKNNEDLLMNYYLFSFSNKSIFEDKCFYHYVVRKNSAVTSSITEKKINDRINVLITIVKSNKFSELTPIVESRLVAIYVNTLSTSKKIISKNYKRNIKIEAKKYKSRKISKKQKLFLRWVLIWPFSFRLVHSLYSRIKGTNKKYSV